MNANTTNANRAVACIRLVVPWEPFSDGAKVKPCPAGGTYLDCPNCNSDGVAIKCRSGLVCAYCGVLYEWPE